jgi:ABC-type glutathione transport system ATPase component
VLQLEKVTLKFGKSITALDEATLKVHRDEVVGLVGESGSGKTMVARTALQLLPSEGQITTGEILYETAEGHTQDLIRMSESELRRHVRGTEIAMIFQNPTGSLNPVRPVGTQIREVLRRHRDLSSTELGEEARSLLQRVGISPDRGDSYASELSGGQAQRVAIARAVACRPRLLIADECTSALDVVIQQKILDLLGDLREDFGMAMLMISHNLQLVANVADRIVVLKDGSVVESGSATQIYHRPSHPYTQKLRESIPEMSTERKA